MKVEVKDLHELRETLALGVDRIMFSIDSPFVENKPGVDWTDTIPLCAEDKEKILSGNVTRLLRL